MPLISHVRLIDLPVVSDLRGDLTFISNQLL
jgi:hypothetical protein